MAQLGISRIHRGANDATGLGVSSSVLIMRVPVADANPLPFVAGRRSDSAVRWSPLNAECGRKSVMFYWDNLVSRRMRSTTLTRQDAIEKATALARAELEKLENPDNPE
jgi:hypothetical protein